jgi:hypothetical protein
MTDPAINHWSDKTCVDAYGSFRYDLEITILEVKGLQHLTPTPVPTPLINAGGAGPTSLAVRVGRRPGVPIITDIDPTTLPSYTTTPGLAFQWRAYVAGARGRPCDGFRVTCKLGHPAVFAGFNDHQGTAVGFAWGEETAPGVTIETGGGIDVRIAGPLPLPVTIDGPDPLPIVEEPATVWTGLGGTAPDGSGGATVATAIGAGAVTRYVDLSSDATNPPGSIIYVKAAAGNLASVSAYKLGPGDVAEGIEVDSQAKIFVLGSIAGLTWTAASV